MEGAWAGGSAASGPATWARLAEAWTAVGTALSPLPRPLGPPPLPHAVRRRRSGRRPLVRLPEAVPSGLFLLGAGEVVSLPLGQPSSQHPALLVGEQAGRDFVAFPPEQGHLSRKSCFHREDQLSVTPASSPAFLET